MSSKNTDTQKSSYVSGILDRMRSFRRDSEDQKDFLKRIGLPYSTFRDWNRGISFPRDDKLFEIASTLGVTPEWLKYGDDHPQTFLEFLATLYPKIPGVRQPGDRPETIKALRILGILITFGDIAEEWKPGIASQEWADTISVPLEEIETWVHAPPSFERASEISKTIAALNKFGKSKAPYITRVDPTTWLQRVLDWHNGVKGGT